MGVPIIRIIVYWGPYGGCKSRKIRAVSYPDVHGDAFVASSKDAGLHYVAWALWDCDTVADKAYIYCLYKHYPRMCKVAPARRYLPLTAMRATRRRPRNRRTSLGFANWYRSVTYLISAPIPEFRYAPSYRAWAEPNTRYRVLGFRVLGFRA